MSLSPHFAVEEFDQDAPIPDDCLPIFELLCNKILEPIRDYINEPITITSGYRPSDVNKAVHGSPTSEHVASPKWCAADFSFETGFGKILSVRAVFDWIRNSQLPFHQVILEHDATGRSIIHVSINLMKPGVRQALEGATHNASAYTTWDVVPYEENA
jgi:hypothetical protein